jgi:hypothetical protein
LSTNEKTVPRFDRLDKWSIWMPPIRLRPWCSGIPLTYMPLRQRPIAVPE